MNRSGGLFWHARAWRRQGAWRGTCQHIRQWLEQVHPNSSQLVIIGASAGWMMPSPWLQGFDRVSTVDIDRWAAPLFRMRHGSALKSSGTQLRCHTGDALGDLQTLLAAHPDAAVLFDNVLGQLRFMHDSVDEAVSCLDMIKQRLVGREWGSLHDAYSGAVRRGGRARKKLVTFQSLQAVAAVPTLSGDAGVPIEHGLAPFANQLEAEGEWLDHLTSQVFPAGTTVHHIALHYSRHYCHWLQAGWVSSKPRACRK
jgi:hypothetical protein